MILKWETNELDSIAMKYLGALKREKEVVSYADNYLHFPYCAQKSSSKKLFQSGNPSCKLIKSNFTKVLSYIYGLNSHSGSQMAWNHKHLPSTYF